MKNLFFGFGIFRFLFGFGGVMGVVLGLGVICVFCTWF
jgi:hypothetical protein